MDCIVVKKGKYFNLTYSSIRWTKWGMPTDYTIIVCDDWTEGFSRAKSSNHRLVLFLDSGTVFNDIELFVDKLKSYPNKGLIGHIIDHQKKEIFYSLHQQCFFLDINNFDKNSFLSTEFDAPLVERSNINIHDDYTPLWLKPSKGKSNRMIQSEFGQKIIAEQISKNKLVVNWHQKLRDNKIFLYRPEVRTQWLEIQKQYTDLAEKHLWVLNNQQIEKLESRNLVSPASGIFWMAGNNAEQIDLVDISQPQLNLAKHLIENWDGANYGEFVYNFILKNKIRHIQLDINMTDMEKVNYLKNKKLFCEYVNSKFNIQLHNFGLSPADFINKWLYTKNKIIKLHNANMVDWINQAKLTSDTGVWLSNILNYKYTWLKSTESEIEGCREKLKRIGCIVRE